MEDFATVRDLDWFEAMQAQQKQENASLSAG